MTVVGRGHLGLLREILLEIRVPGRIHLVLFKMTIAHSVARAPVVLGVSIGPIHVRGRLP